MNLPVFKAARRHRESAHSLPEALIAVMITGTMLVSLYAGFSSGFTIVQSAREDLRATQIILGRLEGIRLYSWTQLLDTTNYLKPFVEYYNPLGETNSSSGTIYAGSISTSLPALSPAKSYRTDMLEIRVRVYWTNYSGGQPSVRTRQMVTYIARNGMQK